jgi:predicted phage terminase large subunit-like protein
VGKHADVISIDDVHNEENTSTSKQCDSVTKVYYSTILGRAKPSGCKFVLAGRRWREDDLYGRLERSGEWVTMKLPVERKGAKQLYWDVVMAPDVVNIFSEEFKPDFQDKEGMMHYKVPYAIDPKGQGFFWPAMPQKRKEFMAVKKGDPATFEATYQCNPGNRESGVFLDSDFRYVDEAPSLQECLAQGATIYQAWDTATGSSPKSDFSVCITAAFFPCEHYHHNEDRDLYGECDPHMDVYILDVYRENIEFAALFSAVKTQYQKWRPSTIVMEKKSSGISILQLARNIAPIEEVNPGAEGKRARATNTVGTGTASVQGWFRLGRVLFPRNAPWLEALTTELKDFSGDGSGKDDQVDALVYIVAAAIRLGGGGAMLPSNAEELANSTGDNNFYPDDKSGLQTALGSVFSVESVLDPFRMTCGKCKHLTQTSKCKFTGKSMINLDSCEKFEPSAKDGWELMVI